jgi:hypothetical protein
MSIEFQARHVLVTVVIEHQAVIRATHDKCGGILPQPSVSTLTTRDYGAKICHVGGQ